MSGSTVQTSPLDQLLEGKSAEFKGKVLALVRRYNIDENDPTFILLLGTSTLEVLLDTYPKEFDKLFEQLLVGMEERWQGLQKEWAATAEKSAGAANHLTQIVSQVKQAAEAEQNALTAQAQAQAGLLEKVYQQQRETLHQETEKMIVQGTAISYKAAAEQFQQNAKHLRIRYYAEAAAFVCFGASLIFFSGWAYGWHSRGVRESKTIWADIERWNGNELQACLKVKTNTCNFHIEVPKNENAAQ